MTNGDEGRGPGEGPGEDELAQSQFVGRLRPDPAGPPVRVRTLAGLLGNSDREGYRRLYFTRDLDFYAEFRTEDVMSVEPVAVADQPMPGLEASRVSLRRDAAVDFTRSRTPRPVDEFDLDVRLRPGAGRARARLEPETWEAECPGPSFFAPCNTDFGCIPTDTVEITICRGRTCDTCRTLCEQATCETCRTRCDQATCATCRTRCGQPTCATCDTCQTACGQVTCDTCETACGQATCETCRTDCFGRTCETCDTCDRDVPTCGFCD